MSVAVINNNNNQQQQQQAQFALTLRLPKPNNINISPVTTTTTNSLIGVRTRSSELIEHLSINRNELSALFHLELQYNNMKSKFKHWLSLYRRNKYNTDTINKFQHLSNIRSLSRIFTNWYNCMKSTELQLNQYNQLLVYREELAETLYIQRQKELQSYLFNYWYQLSIEQLEYNKINIQLLWYHWRSRYIDKLQSKSNLIKAAKQYEYQLNLSVWNQWLILQQLNQQSKYRLLLANSFYYRQSKSRAIQQLKLLVNSKLYNQYQLKLADQFYSKRIYSIIFTAWYNRLSLELVESSELQYSIKYSNNKLLYSILYNWKYQYNIKLTVQHWAEKRSKSLLKSTWLQWRIVLMNYYESIVNEQNRIINTANKLSIFINKVLNRAQFKLCWKYWLKYIKLSKLQSQQSIALYNKIQLNSVSRVFTELNLHSKSQLILHSQYNQLYQYYQTNIILKQLFHHWNAYYHLVKISNEYRNKLTTKLRNYIFNHWVSGSKSKILRRNQSNSLLPNYLAKSTDKLLKYYLQQWIINSAKRLKQESEYKLLLINNSKIRLKSTGLLALKQFNEYQYNTNNKRALIYYHYCSMNRALNRLKSYLNYRKQLKLSRNYHKKSVLVSLKFYIKLWRNRKESIEYNQYLQRQQAINEYVQKQHYRRQLSSNVYKQAVLSRWLFYVSYKRKQRYIKSKSRINSLLLHWNHWRREYLFKIQQDNISRAIELWKLNRKRIILIEWAELIQNQITYYQQQQKAAELDRLSILRTVFNSMKQSVIDSAASREQQRLELLASEELIQLQQSIEIEREQLAVDYYSKHFLSIYFNHWLSIYARIELLNNQLNSPDAAVLRILRVSQYFYPWLNRTRRLVRLESIDSALKIIWLRNSFTAWSELVLASNRGRRIFQLSRCFSAWKLSVKRIRAKRIELKAAEEQNRTETKRHH